MNDNFGTQDIKLATWLKINGVPFSGVSAVDQYNSQFNFEQPSPDILKRWFSESGKTQLIIDTYRSLLRQARQKQKGEVV